MEGNNETFQSEKIVYEYLRGKNLFTSAFFSWNKYKLARFSSTTYNSHCSSLARGYFYNAKNCNFTAIISKKIETVLEMCSFNEGLIISTIFTS